MTKEKQDGASADGPSLETYVETRFNLVQTNLQTMAEQLRREMELISGEINRHFELKRQQIALMDKAIEDKMFCNDQRYEQRFQAQQEASRAAIAAVNQLRTDAMDIVDARFAATEKSLKDLSDQVKERVAVLEVTIDGKFRTTQDLANAIDTASREAISKSERQTELRFDSVNEFRQTLAQQANEFLGKTTFEESQKSAMAYRDSINSRFDQINTRLNLREGEMMGGRHVKDDSRANWSMVVAIGAVVVTVILAILPGVIRPAGSNSPPIIQTPSYIVPPGFKLVPNTEGK